MIPHEARFFYELASILDRHQLTITPTAKTTAIRQGWAPMIIRALVLNYGLFDRKMAFDRLNESTVIMRMGLVRALIVGDLVDSTEASFLTTELVILEELRKLFHAYEVSICTVWASAEADEPIEVSKVSALVSFLNEDYVELGITAWEMEALNGKIALDKAQGLLEVPLCGALG